MLTIGRARFVTACVLMICLSGCVLLPSDPETPVGVRVADGGGPIDVLTVVYMACEGETVEEVRVLGGDDVLVPSAERVVLGRAPAAGGSLDLRGPGLIEVDVALDPTFREAASISERGAGPTFDGLVVQVESDLFVGGRVFVVDELRASYGVLTGGEVMRLDEFQERFDCERHRS
jgi:hypothetical protein